MLIKQLVPQAVKVKATKQLTIRCHLISALAVWEKKKAKKIKTVECLVCVLLMCVTKRLTSRQPAM